jgi:hypothetical protein
MLALFRDANALRRRFPALRRGGVAVLHEVRGRARPRGRARAARGPLSCLTAVRAGRLVLPSATRACKLAAWLESDLASGAYLASERPTPCVVAAGPPERRDGL